MYKCVGVPLKLVDFSAELVKMCRIISTFIGKFLFTFINNKPKIIMKRKDYQKPTMDVVKLRHRTHLLQMSVQKGKPTVQDYTWHNDEVEE